MVLAGKKQCHSGKFNIKDVGNTQKHIKAEQPKGRGSCMNPTWPLIEKCNEPVAWKGVGVSSEIDLPIPYTLVFSCYLSMASPNHYPESREPGDLACRC